ncbi:MAG: hypothetical protein AAF639_10435 [Chloroflexota bacterium]
MQDTQVLKLQVTQVLDRLPAEGLRLLAKFASLLEAKFMSFYQKDDAQEKDIQSQTVTDDVSVIPAEYMSPALFALQQEVLEAVKDQPTLIDEPFIDNVTLGEYFELSDDEQAKLWDSLSYPDMMDFEEKEVNSVP